MIYLTKHKILSNKKYLNHETKIFNFIGFGAFSVSESQVQNVVEYIKNQEVHHRGKSFSEEYQLFLKKYNIVVNG